MNQKEIQELIKQVSKANVTEVEIERKDFKIIIKSESKRRKGEVEEERMVYIQPPMGQSIPQMPAMPATTPSSAPQSVGQAATEETTSDDSKYITVKSPMIGTFYRSSAPDKPLFVEVGDTIKEGDTICIIEAMKLFNEIEAEVKGKIVKVLVDDSTPVEYDQPLFLVDPA